MRRILKSIPTLWKLTAVFTFLLIFVLGVTSCISNHREEQSALSAARDAFSVCFDTLESRLPELMMNRDTAGTRALMESLVEHNPECCDIRLISHQEGRIIAPKEADGAMRVQDHRSCRACHDLEDPAERLNVEGHDAILELPEGGRILSVTGPMFNHESCRNADCHAHAEGPAVLGIVEADFSLGRLDALTAGRNLRTLIAVAVVVLLSCGAAWFTLNRFFKGPVRGLIYGMNQLAERRFDFRLDEERKDEFRDLAASFNDMAAMLAAAQNELNKSQDYLRGILESTADIIVTMTHSGRIQTINMGAEQALGYLRQEVVGTQIESLFADAGDAEQAFELLKSTGTVVNFQTRFATKDDDTRDVLLTFSQLKNPQGAVVGTIGIGKDITEEVRLQKELIQSQRLAAIGQVFTGIQHSMKNMLNAMKGGAFMVKTGLKKDDRAMLEEGWGMVQEGISRMTEMSLNMLKYVKEWKPDLQKVDLTPTLTDVQQVIEQTAIDKGVAFTMKLSPELPAVICDASMMHTAVMDIVSNALDACLMKEYGDGETPGITVSAYPDEDGRAAVVEIVDNGCGMSEKVKANIFTPFFSTKEKTGTGLGLAITSRIINVHGGTIEVESEPDRGAVFRIVVPVDGMRKRQGGN